jgi:hypothetical protein
VEPIHTLTHHTLTHSLSFTHKPPFCILFPAFCAAAPQIRSMAAATISCMLEGPPQRAFLAVAEARALPPATSGQRPQPPVRGFTTLSSSLGQMVLALHRWGETMGRWY